MNEIWGSWCSFCVGFDESFSIFGRSVPDLILFGRGRRTNPDNSLSADQQVACHSLQSRYRLETEKYFLFVFSNGVKKFDMT
jgi:hypothetical protein